MTKTNETPATWLVKTQGNNEGKIFGWNPILARRKDMAPYDGPIDERGFAAGYADIPENSIEEPAMEDINTTRKTFSSVPETLDQQIFRLRKEKNSLAKIAEIVGKSKTAVYKRLRKLESTKGGKHAF
jgi:hypothetical protein